MGVIPIVETRTWRRAWLPLVPIAGLSAIAALPRIALNDALLNAHLAAIAVIAVWYAALLARKRVDPDALHVRVRLAPPNAIPWLVAADAHQLDVLRALTLDFVRTNFRRIRMVARDTLPLLAESPHLTVEVMDGI